MKTWEWVAILVGVYILLQNTGLSAPQPDIVSSVPIGSARSMILFGGGQAVPSGQNSIPDLGGTNVLSPGGKLAS
jgi:hypothetical protein